MGHDGHAISQEHQYLTQEPIAPMPGSIQMHEMSGILEGDESNRARMNGIMGERLCIFGPAPDVAPGAQDQHVTGDTGGIE